MSDPVSQYLAYQQTATSPTNAPDPVSAYLTGQDPLLAQYRSGALAKRMAGANQRDQANLADAQASTPGALTQYLQSIAGNAANIAQGIPGMEAAQAGIGALASHVPGLRPEGGPLSYQQSLDALRGQTAQINPVISAMEKMAGGVATMPFLPASPVLAGAALGAADQALGAGPESLRQRAENTAIGAGVGGLAGGIAHGVTGLGSAVVKRFMPDIAVRAAARDLIAPSNVAEMYTANELAPGGASVATSTRPDAGLATSRFLPMIRAIGNNPVAASRAEAQVGAQRTALNTARKAIGARMDEITGRLPVSADLRQAVANASKLVGESHAPALRVDPESGTSGYDVQDLRNTLSRLRFAMRGLQKQGPNASGLVVKDYADAIGPMTDALNTFSPTLGRLDSQYAQVMDHTRAANDVLKTIQRSRANYAGTNAFSKDAESLGASIHGHGPSFYTHLHNLLSNPSGTADAVARMIVQPGGSEMAQTLLRGPLTTPANLAKYSLLAANPLAPHP